MRTPIPNLRGSPTHQLAVAIYQGHQDDGTGRCSRCGDRSPCGPHQHAASVIYAASEDPRSYDAPPSPVAETYPTHTGFRVGGRAAPLDNAGYYYERDIE